MKKENVETTGQQPAMMAGVFAGANGGQIGVGFDVAREVLEKASPAITGAPLKPGDTCQAASELGRSDSVRLADGGKRSIAQHLGNAGLIHGVSLRRKGSMQGTKLRYMPNNSQKLHQLLQEQNAK